MNESALLEWQRTNLAKFSLVASLVKEDTEERKAEKTRVLVQVSMVSILLLIAIMIYDIIII